MQDNEMEHEAPVWLRRVLKLEVNIFQWPCDLSAILQYISQSWIKIFFTTSFPEGSWLFESKLQRVVSILLPSKPLSCEVWCDGFCKVFNACVVVLVSILYELENGCKSPSTCCRRRPDYLAGGKVDTGAYYNCWHGDMCLLPDVVVRPWQGY